MAEYYRPYIPRNPAFLDTGYNTIAGLGWHSNGHYMVKVPEGVAYAVSRKPEPETETAPFWNRTLTQEVLDRIFLSLGQGSLATIAGECIIENRETVFVHVHYPGGHLFYNVLFVDSVLTLWPGVMPLIGDSSPHSLFFVNGCEIVGIIMPIRVSGGDLITADDDLPRIVRENLKEGK